MRTILDREDFHLYRVYGLTVVRNRRKFVAGTTLAVVSAGVFGVGFARAQGVRTLELQSLHTNEYLYVPFRSGGELLKKNLGAIDHLLRDHRTNEVHPIDTRLLDYLFDLGEVVGIKGPYQVISGYRSAATNAKLRRSSAGVAKRSLHMAGRAIDIRVPDIPASVVRDAAISLRRGGVGYYPRSDFVHLDTGRFRHW